MVHKLDFLAILGLLFFLNEFPTLTTANLDVGDAQVLNISHHGADNASYMALLTISLIMPVTSWCSQIVSHKASHIRVLLWRPPASEWDGIPAQGHAGEAI